MSSSVPLTRRPGRAGVQSAKLSGRAGVNSSESLFASGKSDALASRFRSAGPRQAWQTESVSPPSTLASSGTHSRVGRRSKHTDSWENRPNSAPFGSVQKYSHDRSLTSSWQRHDFTHHDERLVTFDDDEFDAPASVTAPNRPKPRPRTAQAWLHKIENYSPFPRAGGEPHFGANLMGTPGLTLSGSVRRPVALRDENLELETPRSPAFFVDLGLSGTVRPLPEQPGRSLLSSLSPAASPSKRAVSSPWPEQRAVSPGPEQREGQGVTEEEMCKLSELTTAAEVEMQKHLEVLDARERRISAARIRPSDARAMREKAEDEKKKAATAKIPDFSIKPAPKKILEPSERLLQTKHEKKEAIRVKSYRVRMDELNAKVSMFRFNKSDLEDKIRKTKLLMRANQQFDCVSSNRLAIHDVHTVQNQAELRVLRAMEDELKMLVNRVNCKNRRRETHIQKLVDIEEREQRKVNRKVSAEREAYETQMAAFAMVLLPAFAAAARVSRLGELMQKAREYRIHHNSVNWAASIICRNLRWISWNRQFKRKIVIKGFLRRNLWFAVFNFRCRRKMRAATKISVFMKECYGRLPITIAFARYKYKIIVLQRLCRTSIQARKSRLDVLYRQWTALVMYYRDYQNFGMVTQKRVSFTEALKKNLENTIISTKGLRSLSPLTSKSPPGTRRGSTSPAQHGDHHGHLHSSRPSSPVVSSRAPKARGRRQSLYIQHGAALTRRTGIDLAHQKGEGVQPDRRRSSYYQPSYLSAGARQNPHGAGHNPLGIHPSLLGRTISEASDEGSPIRRRSNSEWHEDGNVSRRGSAEPGHMGRMSEFCRARPDTEAEPDGSIPIHSEHCHLDQPPSWDNAHEQLLSGGIAAVRGVNFFLVPLEPNEQIKEMLKDLSRTRMQRFSEDLREWRVMYKEWTEHRSEYESEARAKDLIHGKADDHIPTFLAPETVQMKREVDRATKDYKGRKKFYLQDGKALFTWSRWRSKPKGDRKRDVEYRRKGPPRPVYRNMLDEEEELWPVLEKARLAV